MYVRNSKGSTVVVAESRRDEVMSDGAELPGIFRVLRNVSYSLVPWQM